MQLSGGNGNDGQDGEQMADLSLDSGITESRIALTLEKRGGSQTNGGILSSFKGNNAGSLQINTKQHSQGSSGDSPVRRLSQYPSLTVDEILEEVGNLDINDLDTLLSADNKSYKKKSMQFLQNLITQLKKTKVFKDMV